MADGTIAQLAAQAQMAGAGSTLEQIFLQVTARDGTAEPAATPEP